MFYLFNSNICFILLLEPVRDLSLSINLIYTKRSLADIELRNLRRRNGLNFKTLSSLTGIFHELLNLVSDKANQIIITSLMQVLISTRMISLWCERKSFNLNPYRTAQAAANGSHRLCLKSKP